jgi:hypothetical protein
VGASINLLTYPTKKARSGLEFTRYRREPTMDLYWVASTVGDELVLLNFNLDSIGV